MLFSPLRDIRHDYEHNFQGMTADPVPLNALLDARARIVRELQQGLDDNERRFLLSLVADAPDWRVKKGGLWWFRCRIRGGAGETVLRAVMAPVCPDASVTLGGFLPRTIPASLFLAN